MKLPLLILATGVLVAAAIVGLDLLMPGLGTPSASAAALWWKDSDNGIDIFTAGCVGSWLDNSMCTGAPQFRGPDFCGAEDLSLSNPITEMYVKNASGSPTTACVATGPSNQEFSCEDECQRVYRSQGFCEPNGGDCYGNPNFRKAYCFCSGI